MAQGPTHAERIDEAKKLGKTDPEKAEKIYTNILSQGPGQSDTSLRDYENALMGLGELYRDHKQVHQLGELITQTRSVLSSFAKAKTAKLGMPLHYHSQAQC